MEILANVLERITLGKGADPAQALAAVQQEYPKVEDFERDFPSLCFALAIHQARRQRGVAYRSCIARWNAALSATVRSGAI